MKVEGFSESSDAEFWHGKALELSVRFLPGDAPLVKHIVSSYKKHHSPCQEEIPEESEVSQAVVMIKPLEGITMDQMTPVIRHIEKPSVKLQSLDLAPNDYVSDYVENLEPKEESKMIEQTKANEQGEEKEKISQINPLEGLNLKESNIVPEEKVIEQTPPQK